MVRPLFNQENNRLNYGRLLQPDAGYSLDFAVGLTYSADLEALLGVPVSLGLLEEMDSGQRSNPFFLLEAIRRSSDKLAVFCNAGCIKLPQKIEPVYALLENSVFSVPLDNKANFHPKLWLIKYTSPDQISYIKVVVLSRNLTFDRSFDVAAEMSGKIGADNNDKNKPLADMLRFVAKFAENGKEKKIKALAAEIMKVSEFDLGDQFEDYEFCPFGIPGYRNTAAGLLTAANELLVVSPFLSDGVVEQLTDTPYNTSLITRKSSVTSKIFSCFDKVYITKDIVLNDELLGEADAAALPKRDVHAKAYFLNRADGNYFFLGSLNASQNAFYRNVEFLLKLKFKPYRMSYHSMCRDFIPEENSPFELLQAPDESVCAETASEETDLRDVVWALQSADVASAGERFDVTIRVNEDELSSTLAQIAPLYQPRAFVSVRDGAALTGLLLKELSEFYIVKRGEVCALVKLPTDGIPLDERDNAIYKSIINSKNAFLAYVTFMLADDYLEAAMEQKDFITEMLQPESSLEQTAMPSALYERMLKAVADQPAKFLDIENIMSKLDPAIVTDDFKVLFAAFYDVAKKVLKK